MTAARARPPRSAGVANLPRESRQRIARVPEPGRLFGAPKQIKVGQVVFDRVKNMPCTVVFVQGGMVRVVRPAGEPWDVHYRRLLPGTAYHCRQLDALAELHATRLRGRQQPASPERQAPPWTTSP